MFSNLRQGSLVYILHKKNGLKVSTGQIIETNATNFNNGYFPTQGNNLINIRVNVDGKEEPYGNIQGGLSVISYDNGNIILADSQDIIVTEIQNAIKQSESRLASRDYDELIISTGKTALAELNPQYAENKKREEEIANIQQQINTMNDKFDKLISALSKNENK